MQNNIPKLYNEEEWHKLEWKLIQFFGKKPDLNAILFLIGVQELGKGFRNFSKEEKQDLMHIGLCKILSFSGYYELEGVDEDGWQHWKNVKKVPFLHLLDQEDALKMHILEYFKNENLFV